MHHLKDFLEALGPIIYAVGIIAVIVGYGLSYFNISFGEEYWERLESIKSSRYFFSYVCWVVHHYFRTAAVALWYIIAVCLLIYAFEWRALFSLANSSRATLGILGTSNVQWWALFGGISLVCVFLVRRKLLPKKDLPWKMRDSRWGSVWVRESVNVLLVLLSMMVLIFCGSGWRTVAVGDVPLLAASIVQNYHSLTIGPLLAFGVITLSVYPIAVHALVRVISYILYLAVRVTPYHPLRVVARKVLWWRKKKRPLGMAVPNTKLNEALRYVFGGIGALGAAVPAAAASVFWTMVMLIWGNHVQWDATELSRQVLISNAIFDGMSVYFTMVILEWAAAQYGAHRHVQFLLQFSERLPRNSKERESLEAQSWRYQTLWDLQKVVFGNFRTSLMGPFLRYSTIYRFGNNWFVEEPASWSNDALKSADLNWWRPICAIFVNLGIAALLSGCALYFSVWRTSGELSLAQVLWVFVGGFDGKRFTELGPLFWVTHSTFLPAVLIWVVMSAVAVLAYGINPLGNIIARAGRATLANPRAGLMKYGIALLPIAEGAHQFSLLIGRYFH